MSVVVPGKDNKGKSYAEYQAEKMGTSWKGKLKIAVDALIPQAADFADFLQLLQAAGYEQWTKIQNLKQAAKTMNFLTENQIEQYTDLEAQIDEVTTANEHAADALKGVEKRLADMALLIKNITTYQKTKPVYDAYRKAKNTEQYRAAHERSWYYVKKKHKLK